MLPDSKFDRARAEIEGEDTAVPDRRDKKTPPAGPHAKKNSTNEDATPGTGSLPSVEPSDEVEAGTG
jgi:hypothetical protein